MESHVATQVSEARARRSARSIVVLSLGPASILGGIVWAIFQPYRLTILDPHGQGFWWLFSEAPLYPIVVGLLFHFLIAPGVVEDLEAEELERR